MHGLKEKGIPVDVNATTVDEAKNEILKALGKKGMLKDITLGQYYPADSVMHKLDPRVKLFGNA